MSRAKVRANSFMFFPEFMLTLMRALEQGVSATEFEHFSNEGGLDIEFEVYIKKVNGKALPRVTQRMLQQAKKETK